MADEGILTSMVNALMGRKAPVNDFVPSNTFIPNTASIPERPPFDPFNTKTSGKDQSRLPATAMRGDEGRVLERIPKTKSAWDQLIPALNNMGTNMDKGKWDAMLTQTSQDASAPVEDIRNDPMARGMAKNDLLSIVNYLRKDAENSPNPNLEAINAIHRPTAVEYNNLLDKEHKDYNKGVEDYLVGAFKQPPTKLMSDAGYMDVPVALPNGVTYKDYPQLNEPIPVPRPRPTAKPAVVASGQPLLLQNFRNEWAR